MQIKATHSCGAIDSSIDILVVAGDRQSRRIRANKYRLANDSGKGVNRSETITITGEIAGKTCVNLLRAGIEDQIVSWQLQFDY